MCKNDRTAVPHKILNNGVEMPMVGLGVYNISSHETQRVVEEAIAEGYRSIDTAAMYHNEDGVGAAVRSSGVPREELFVTTKICEPCYTEKETMLTIETSIKKLGLDYVDLMLLHWPVGKPDVMWHTLEQMYKEQLFRAIGVSNFYPNTFPLIANGASIMPVVNQCECSVLYQQRKMMEYMKPHNVALEAWSPLAEGRHGIPSNATLAAIGMRHGKTAAQVALKFLVQNGIVIIPKTTHRERMRENIDLFDFELTEEEINEIRWLDTGHNVTGWPSDALTYNPHNN